MIVVEGKNGKIQFMMYDIVDKNSPYKSICFDIDITIENFTAKGKIDMYGNDFSALLEKLEHGLKIFQSFTWINMDKTLSLEFQYDKSGRYNIIGEYKNLPYSETKLHFKIETDQSYLNTSIYQMKALSKKII